MQFFHFFIFKGGGALPVFETIMDQVLNYIPACAGCAVSNFNLGIYLVNTNTYIQKWRNENEIEPRN